MNPRSKMFFKWVLVVGLVIVTNLFFAYAIDVFYQEPKFETYCTQEQVRPLIETEKECTDIGGQWTETPPQKYPSKVVPAEEGMIIAGYCNEYFTCQKDFDAAMKVYARNVFVALVALGVALIIGSYFVAQYGAVSLGFALAGLLALIIGTVRYWSFMDEKLRVIVLGVALIALVWFGIKKFKE